MCYRPYQYYDDISVTSSGGKVTVSASGSLATCGEKYPKKSEYTFRATYVFNGDVITVRYYTDAPFDGAKMLIGTHGETAQISAFGFDKTEPQNTDGYDFRAPHGAITAAYLAFATKTAELGYEVILK